ncbi:MAG: sugar phosphate isomerase/epimerase [Planctomycetes bacterium]|nr:sugar phosphate isomerase/epimerase [Planctomycetota bacterium]
MRLAFSSNAFRGCSLEQTIGILAGIGYDGLEIMGDAPHLWPPDMDEARAESIRAALRRHRSAISNVNAFMMCGYRDPRTGRPGTFHWPSWIDADAETRRARAEHTRGCVEWAARLGARTVSTEPGGPIEGRPREEMVRLFARELEPVARRAAELGVTLLIEPEPGLLIQTSREFEEFMEGHVRFQGVGLNFDAGHFFCVGEDPVALIRRFGRRAAHFHIEDIAATRVHHHLPPGDGAMDFRAIFAALREVGYDDWITIELYPFQEDAPEVAKRAHEFVRPFLGER